ncbi:MAG: hypothetical protein KKA97_08680 [Actinobacteria bacterium]|nr:hypothetical protein [Actinomycetota bacterium]
MTFRAFNEGLTTPFHGYYGFRHADGQWTWQSLTAHFATYGVNVVADPKLFTSGGRVLVTFNSGTPPAGENDVYVAEVWPVLGPPLKCLLDGRERIEKNWAFFSEEGGALSAIYSLVPLTFIQAAPGAPDDSTLRFVRTSQDGHRDSMRLGRRLSLGTQPILEQDRLRMVAHEKFWLGRRRAYAGRPITIDGLSTGEPLLSVSRIRLVHTWKDALPRISPSHNPNLLSATYFAGLTRVDGELVASYGINDIGFAITGMEEQLWTL